MRGDPDVLAMLNEVLTGELTAINQYYVHAKMCEHWGYARLAAKKREESLEEMRHADKLISRILYLDGVPNLQRLGSVQLGEDVPEQHRLDLELEVEAVDRLNRAVALCRDKGDNGSRELLAEMLTSEEDSVDWLEQQLSVIKDIGVERYLAEQLH